MDCDPSVWPATLSSESPVKGLPRESLFHHPLPPPRLQKIMLPNIFLIVLFLSHFSAPKSITSVSSSVSDHTSTNAFSSNVSVLPNFIQSQLLSQPLYNYCRFIWNLSIFIHYSRFTSSSSFPLSKLQKHLMFQLFHAFLQVNIMPHL